MENPSSPWADEALYYAAMTLFFEKKAEKAKPLLEKMIHDYPKSKRLAKAKELLRGMP